MSSAISVGSQFDSIEALKQACRQHAVECHFEFRTLCSNRNRYTIACKAAEACKWRLHATSIEETSAFRIRTLQSVHTCHGINHMGNRATTSTFVANLV